MQREIVLFWLVAAGFLVADNLVLLPAGGDLLRFGPAGRLRYDPSVRLEVRRRELVIGNPFNLFQRAAITTHALGAVDVRAYRAARRQIVSALPTMNLLSWLGSAYLLCAVGLAGLSIASGQGALIAVFLLVHLAFWLATALLVLRRRGLLGLTRHQACVLVAEAGLVPAYALNLGKRLWSRRRFELPAMTLGIRYARRMTQEHERELHLHQLLGRLTLIEQELPPVGAGDGQHRSALVRQARACLAA